MKYDRLAAPTLCAILFIASAGLARQDQHQHREGKERDVAEETGITLLSLHIPDGVDMDECAHDRDQREPVRVDAELGRSESPGHDDVQRERGHLRARHAARAEIHACAPPPSARPCCRW